MLRHLDLFSGIGGFALGAQMAGGFRTVAFCEIDPKCRAVLEARFPGVPVYDDVRSVPGIPCDVLTGGFPCQPHSSAARGRVRGMQDDRWLWPAMRDVIAASRPAYVLAENVTQLDGVALEQVVSDLEADGYEVAPPLEIPACAVGFDHWRPRLWILGYAHGNSEPVMSLDAEVAGVPWRGSEPGGVGAADGLSRRMDRLAMLGNAIVPHIAAEFFRAIARCVTA